MFSQILNHTAVRLGVKEAVGQIARSVEIAVRSDPDDVQIVAAANPIEAQVARGDRRVAIG